MLYLYCNVICLVFSRGMQLKCGLFDFIQSEMGISIMPLQFTTMRILLQRVQKAKITINGEIERNIGKGTVVFVGFRSDDTREIVKKMAEKMLNLRYFEDSEGKTNSSIQEVFGEMLIVSQFTLYADTRKGRRPSFIDAARPEVAIPLYEYFVEIVKKSSLHIETGEFGANMLVEIHNDGPFTLWLDSEEKSSSIKSSSL